MNKIDYDAFREATFRCTVIALNTMYLLIQVGSPR